MVWESNNIFNLKPKLKFIALNISELNISEYIKSLNVIS